MSPDDVKLCDCADCGRVMLGESMGLWATTLSATQRARWPVLVGGRVRGRPYCHSCLAGKRVPAGRSGRLHNDGSQDNAVRCLEDAT
jgi:hypothetical protein